ncbi:hypothetical protein SEA_GRETCHEN_10 [Microbacterium phage Gretchen]|uniref:Uncharacterized protein n=1 Tax=Microbacterium phage Percival TaxID=2201439 RepID=A0A2Z4Q878_9CAUD|nr:hypothetical protein PBI_PERCIVAL_10 [Microbacterium phage Percival]UDL14784.1 hypothetical protein SEA_GRETCHEN_10 [Microbacterium phage Gretchen]
MSSKIKLNSPGIRAAALNSAAVRREVAAFADTMAGRLEGRVIAHDGPAPIKRDSYTTDRVGEGVTIAHPGGIGLEAEHGYLTAAARSVGLSIGRKK